MLSVVAQCVWPHAAPVECLGSTPPCSRSFRSLKLTVHFNFFTSGGPTILAKIQKNSGQVRPAAKKEGVGCCVSQSWHEAFCCFFKNWAKKFCVAHIGDAVNEGQTIALINNEFPVISQLSGFIRGMAGEGLEVTEGLKIGDVDPREKESVDATRISDKARNLSGAVLEVLVRHFNRCLPDYVYSRKIKELK
ncbi:MAG: hypothetical protein EZS28_025173 [Streblomastix strix]|uniref:Uncharacterized protein n=1 Tax=Streblomastix strix TaxID=222440 RepID=A0A5J4VA26_9EUKA|nr:MAG: hypothetical protein EZS28_025173 [Streblomastix strix]